MAGEYLTAAEEAAYGRYAHNAQEQSVLERFFFLDGLDRELVAKRRGDHNRLGFGLQLVTVRHLGALLRRNLPGIRTPCGPRPCWPR
nr:DUF4158 domain-containing protein [Arthrobacter sp. 9MFCol3.1]